jgi:hypothetical protein
MEGDYDEEVVNACFRRIFNKQPKYNVGDVVETTFGTRGKIVEVRKDGEFKTVDEAVYLIEEENGKKQLYHPSAILGYAKPKAKQTTLI